jgi:hypothetical protein
VLMFPAFVAMDSKSDVAFFVREQLSNYNYTFPKAPKVRSFSWMYVTVSNTKSECRTWQPRDALKAIPE